MQAGKGGGYSSPPPSPSFLHFHPLNRKQVTFVYTVLCSVHTMSICSSKLQCFGSGSYIFRIRIRLFFLHPNSDPDRPKIRIRSGKSGSESMDKRPKMYKKKKLYIIFSTLNAILLGQVPPKPNKITSFRSHSFGTTGRIRFFLVRIRIGERAQIHPDPDLKHWL